MDDAARRAIAAPDARPATLGELRATGWEPRPIKEELRSNLLARLGEGSDVFPGVVGYQETVLPAVENAILAGQDILFLGERGQAKTRLARLLVGLLDEAIPVVRGGELNDDPFDPISPAARAIVAEAGDATPIDWLPRDRRYAEKLATPDITIADLIGEVDPIKVAEGRYLSDLGTLHYGLIPRANRGIFALNELPDLAERIQVGLLNILEERDVQVRGYTIRLPLDLFVVASANPEDYTSRGRIITPLKDRLGSQIRTHYPRTLDHEISIMRQESIRFPARDGVPEILVPRFMEELLAELTHLARRSPEINQRSGVSVRVSTANLEVLRAAALKRAVRIGEDAGAPRVSDLGAVLASTAGKIELETAGDDAPEDRVVERLITRALYATWNRLLDVDDLAEVVTAFEDGLVIETGERVPSREYVRWLREVPGLPAALAHLAAIEDDDAATDASARAAATARAALPAVRRVGYRVHPRGPPPEPAAEQGSRPGRPGLPPLGRADAARREPAPVSGFTPDRRHLGGAAGRDPGADARDGAPRDGAARDGTAPDGAARSDGSPTGANRAAAAGPARAARFRAWDGSQVLGELDPDAVMDALREDLLAGGDLEGALERLMEHGIRGADERPDLPGLRDLLDRLARRRRELLEAGKLGDVMGDVRRELDEIVAQERAGIDAREAAAADEAPDEALEKLLRQQAARRREQLDALPRGVGDRIRRLQDYDFMDPAARERFGELTDRLRRTMLDRYAEGLSDALRDMRPEDLAAAREMVRDLNRLLGERLAGGDPDASEFLAKHGRFFPGAESLDDVIEQLASRMAAMQSLLRSLTPEQRAELQSTMDALLRDDRLRWDLAQLAGALDQLLPQGLGQRYRFGGQEEMGLEEALGQMDRLGALDQLAEDLAMAESPGDLGAIDRARAADLLGPDAPAQLDALEHLGRRLEEAGYVTRTGDRLELTPRGTRQIGQDVLDELFARLRRDAFGGHALDRTGRGGERTELTKPYEFGDPFHLDLRATVSNALRREENAPGAGAPDRSVSHPTTSRSPAPRR